MKIQWLGHSCFKVSNSIGQAIVHDPYNGIGQYKLPTRLDADVVLSSHQHGDHNYTDGITSEFEYVTSLGTIETSVTAITGIASYHDKTEGSERGDNIIYTYSLDGLKIAHMGDLGHELTDEQVKLLEDTDILLIPCGGTYTLDGQMAAKVAASIKPRVVIPMHYYTEAVSEYGNTFAPVADFTDAYGKQVTNLNATSLEVDKDSITELSPVVIMEYK